MNPYQYTESDDKLPAFTLQDVLLMGFISVMWSVTGCVTVYVMVLLLFDQDAVKLLLYILGAL